MSPAERSNVAVVAVCCQCGGWVGVMTEDAERRYSDCRREFYKDVAELSLRVERIPGDAFRAGVIPACKGCYDEAPSDGRLEAAGQLNTLGAR